MPKDISPDRIIVDLYQSLFAFFPDPHLDLAAPPWSSADGRKCSGPAAESLVGSSKNFTRIRDTDHASLHLSVHHNPDLPLSSSPGIDHAIQEVNTSRTAGHP